MYDLAVAILGSGDTNYANAVDLLIDLLPETNHIVFIPSYINTDGMKTVFQVLQDAEVNYERVRKSSLIETLLETETKSREFVILNPDGIENEISRCLQAKIPVRDLTKGLYELTELPSPAAEANEEDPVGILVTPVPPSNDLGLESITEPSLHTIETILGRVDQLEKEVKRLSTMVGETNWEPAPLSEASSPAQEKKEDATIGSEDIASGTVPYWKSKRGKLRKAGNSKARPGEVKVLLTEEEIASLD